MKKKFATREEWLHAIMDRLVPMFKEVGAPIPKNVRLSCGFPSVNALGRGKYRAGECWSPDASADKVFEVLISPRLRELDAADTLVHELVHAAVGTECGHKGAFAKTAKAIGLVGKMTQAHAGEKLRAVLKRIIKEVGKYPHAPLVPAKTDEKKQRTRLLKAACEACGYTVRVTRKWLEQDGPPICPVTGHGSMLADDPEDTADE